MDGWRLGTTETLLAKRVVLLNMVGDGALDVPQHKKDSTNAILFVFKMY